MAGLGTRTSDRHVKPKPLIMVKNKPLFAWAIEGLPWDRASELIVVTNKKVAEFVEFKNLLKTYTPKDCNLTVEVLDMPTSGQAETVLKGTENMKKDHGLVIFNCDTSISEDFPRDFERWEGLLGTFSSSNPGMSYLEVDGEKVTKTVEKEVISNCASTGLYYFASREIFKSAYENTNFQNESFIAPMYNSMIQQGLNVGHFATQKVIHLGTSNEIASFG